MRYDGDRSDDHKDADMRNAANANHADQPAHPPCRDGSCAAGHSCDCPNVPADRRCADCKAAQWAAQVAVTDAAVAAGPWKS